VKIKTLQQQDQQNKKTNNMFIVHVHRIDWHLLLLQKVIAESWHKKWIMICEVECRL
jgi:hypothetical protein